MPESLERTATTVGKVTTKTGKKMRTPPLLPEHDASW
jgi:hypothetical protein